MLRISEYIKSSLNKQVKKPLNGTIVIWNLTNNCNLSCLHCYSSSKLTNNISIFNRENIPYIVDKLLNLNTKFVILSGGEPLLFEDLYYVSGLLKEKSINVSLSTNGLLINQDIVDLLKQNFDYIGVSIDGSQKTHDKLRAQEGAYKKSLKSIELLLSNGIKTGLRFTLTNKNYQDLKEVFDTAKSLGVPKIYISHLVDSGRAKDSLFLDKETHKRLSKYIISKAFNDDSIDIVSGNNEQDAVLLYMEFKDRYKDYADYLMQTLQNWGGNRSGNRIINIDYHGNVKPDPFFNHTFTNILKKDAIESMKKDEVYVFLNEYPRKLKGKCANCEFLEICNGGSRARAFNKFGDYAMEDPSCFI